MNPASAAVIGAGLAGIACARRLSNAGWQLRVFESQRSPGGRVATRRYGAAAFDHGAQYLSVREPAFRAAIEAARVAWHTALTDRLRAVPMAPCWAAMVVFARPLEDVPDAGFTDDAILPWFARNGSKPGRDSPDAWVLHASAEYSRREFDAPPARVQKALLTRFAGQLGRSLPDVLLSDSHRWRHARVEAPLGEPFLLDRAAGIGFCGDWCLDARAEAAYLSGDAIGTALSATRISESSGKMRDSR